MSTIRPHLSLCPTNHYWGHRQCNSRDFIPDPVGRHYKNPQKQETKVKQFHMADVFRTQTCVMVASPGSGTSHPNTLPLGQRKGINGEEEE